MAGRGEPLWRDRGAGREIDVVGLGQNALDHVVQVDGLPPLGGKVRAAGYAQRPGGQIATAMRAAARLGLRAAYLGSVGDDGAAETVLAPLRDDGIDVSGVRRTPGAPTQIGLILVDRKSGERAVVWHRDPRLALRPEDVSRRAIERGRALHLDAGDLDTSRRAASAAREAGLAVVLDADTPAPGIESLLAAVDFPIVSRGFAEALSGTGSVTDALDRLVSLGARLAVVTLGEVGAVAQQGERRIRSPGFAVEPRDTTGAGDVFHAAFVWGLLEGLDAEGVLRAANAAAAMACRGEGAQGGLPTRSELEAFLQERRPADWRGP